jgi:hypothetical protein
LKEALRANLQFAFILKAGRFCSAHFEREILSLEDRLSGKAKVEKAAAAQSLAARPLVWQKG